MEPNSGDRQIRMVLFTADTLLALGAHTVLSTVREFHVVTAGVGLSGLVPLVEQTRPNILLVDPSPEMTLGVVSALRRVAPGTRLLLWGRPSSAELDYQARELGIAGFLQRDLSPEAFIGNLREVAEGGELFDAQTPAPVSEKSPAPAPRTTTVPLTRRESQLVTLLAQGLKNKEIAACIGISEGTVRIYLSKLFLKLGARDRLEVAVFGLKNASCGQAPWDGRNAFVTEADEDRARPFLRSLVLVQPSRQRSASLPAVPLEAPEERGGERLRDSQKSA